MTTLTVSPGITRFDFEKRKGYMVRIKRGKKRHNIWIPDKKFGGKRKALLAAKQKHAELLKELGPAQPSTKNRLTSRNTSGHVGVHLDRGYDARWDTYNETYIASWLDEDGSRPKICFSTKKYGKRKAFQLACIAREHEIKDRDAIMAIFEKRQKKSVSGSAKKPKTRKTRNSSKSRRSC